MLGLVLLTLFVQQFGLRMEINTVISQEDFGNTADTLLKVILLTMDRAGEKHEKLDMIIRFIESINSEENINIDRFHV